MVHQMALQLTHAPFMDGLLDKYSDKTKGGNEREIQSEEKWEVGDMATSGNFLSQLVGY